MVRSKVVAAALLAGTLFAAACGSSSGGGGDAAPDATGGSGSAGEVCTADRVGGEVTMGTFTETRGLDPMMINGSGVAGGSETAAIFDRLVAWDPDTGEFTPWVAQSLEPDATFATWTMKLRPEVRFGNGDPLTAEAVKFSLERMQGDANKTPSRAAALLVSKVEVVDPLTVRYVLPQPWPGFPALLSDEPGMVVNPKVVQALGAEQFNKLPVGAGVGPYEPEQFSPGEAIVLKAKTDYWNGPVCIERLRFVRVLGGEATYQAFQNGELQVALLRQPQVIAQAADDGVSTFESLQNLGEMLYLNTDANRPTSDVRVRQAIAAAVDPAMIDQRINEGTGRPTSALIGEGSLYDTGLQGPRFDQAEARRLLDQVKQEKGWDGKVTLICDTARTDHALAIEAQLQAAGFLTETNSNLDLNDLLQRQRVTRDFDLGCGGFNVNDTSPWLRLVAKLGADNQSESGYKSPEMAATVDALRLAKDVDETKAALQQMQEVWNRDVPNLNLATVVEAIIWAPEVHGLHFTSKTVVLFDKAYLAR